MKQIYMIGTRLFAGAIAATALSAGCAGAPLRTEESASAIRAAEEVGAAEVPQASLHLQLAKEGMEKAKQLEAEGEKEQAESMLLRSEADAELAVALSHEDAERQEAEKAITRARQLRRDNP